MTLSKSGVSCLGRPSSKIAGELVPVDRVAKDWFEFSRRVRDGMLNLPSRLSGVFAAEASQEKIFELFTKEVHAVLTELSNRQVAPQTITLLPLEEGMNAESFSVVTPADDGTIEATRDEEQEPMPSEPVGNAGPDQADQSTVLNDRFSTGD